MAPFASVRAGNPARAENSAGACGSAQVVEDPPDQIKWPAANVVDDDRYNRVAAFLQARGLDPVMLGRPGRACHSMLSYSATTIASGQAKSTRHSSPQRSTISYCNSGIGNPPSMNTNRASLSIGDSARPSASPTRFRKLTMPRRPFCSRMAASSSTLVPLRCATRRRASPTHADVAAHARPLPPSTRAQSPTVLRRVAAARQFVDAPSDSNSDACE